MQGETTLGNAVLSEAVDGQVMLAFRARMNTLILTEQP